MSTTAEQRRYFEAVPVEKEVPGFAEIVVVLVGKGIPMMAQYRPPGEWWTLGMSQAQKIEKGITHFLREVSLAATVIGITDEQIEAEAEQQLADAQRFFPFELGNNFKWGFIAGMKRMRELTAIKHKP